MPVSQFILSVSQFILPVLQFIRLGSRKVRGKFVRELQQQKIKDAKLADLRAVEQNWSILTAPEWPYKNLQRCKICLRQKKLTNDFSLSLNGVWSGGGGILFPNKMNHNGNSILIGVPT